MLPITAVEFEQKVRIYSTHKNLGILCSQGEPKIAVTFASECNLTFSKRLRVCLSFSTFCVTGYCLGRVKLKFKDPPSFLFIFLCHGIKTAPKQTEWAQREVAS